MTSNTSRRALYSGSVAAFAAIWLFRWLTVSFTNDHFVHLVRARQMLFGEWPVRDFFDPGLPLQYLASAVALAWSHHTLFGEAVLTVTAVALGSALTFYLATRATDSWLLGTLALVLSAETFPRLYNYPKVLLYPLALLCAWRYIERPAAGRLVTVAVVAVTAFLFRHDHGVYVAAIGGVAVVLAHGREPRVAAIQIARFALAGLALSLPFLVYLQVAGGIASYVRQLPDVQSVAAPRLVRLPFHVDSTQPLFTIAPPSQGRVYVRWRQGLDEQQREVLERRYQLRDPVQQSGGWRYDLGGDAAGSLADLLHDPAVAETAGIDRATLQPIVHYRWIRALRNAVPLLRLRIAPSVFTEDNALAWLYYLTVLLPPVGLLLGFIAWRRGRIDDRGAACIATLAVACVIINQGLIRESPDSRIADVIGPAALLAAVTTAIALKTRWRSLAALVALVVWALAIASAALYGHAPEQLAATRILSGPAAIRARWIEVDHRLRLRPIEGYAPAGAGGLAALTRYVFECTSPSDRILVAWFAPEVPFYAERLFAGGQAFLDPGGWQSTVPEQQLTIARLRTQRVPLVIMDQAWEREVTLRFPDVFAWVHDAYAEVGRPSFGGDRPFVILASRSIPPRSVYRVSKLPCFR